MTTQATTSSSATETTTSPPASTGYTFPPHYFFPPFFSHQPNPLTRSSQFASWSTHILSYCRHHRLFSLTLIDALPTPLFTNARLNRRLSLADAREILAWMATPPGGDRVEWIGAAKGKTSEKCWVYWRRPEEWAGVLETWVETTGQKGTVLTLYEIGEGDASKGQGKFFWFCLFQSDLEESSRTDCVY